MNKSFAYRLGTHAAFKTAMLDAIAKSLHPALRGLRTRSDDDFSIALCDAVAVLADNLSFYQERLATESYLNTAIDLRSVRELAALIGYRPAPGLAASTWVAFTLEQPLDAADRSRALTIPSQTRMQSVPSSGGRPQTFETDAAIDARPEWNALQPRLTAPYLPASTSKDLYLQGATLNIRPGDVLLVVGNERKLNPASQAWKTRVIKTVTPEPALDYTYVTWLEPLGPATPLQDPRAFIFRQRAAIFGHSAPDWSGQPDTYKASYFGYEVPDQLTREERIEWPHFDILAPDTTRPKNTDGRFVLPTAEDVAQAMDEAVRAVLLAQGKEVANAIMQAIGNVGQAVQQTLTGFAGSISELMRAGFELPQVLLDVWDDTLGQIFKDLAGVGKAVDDLGKGLGNIGKDIGKAIDDIF
jgi:hypothetical protein